MSLAQHADGLERMAFRIRADALKRRQGGLKAVRSGALGPYAAFAFGFGLGLWRGFGYGFRTAATVQRYRRLLRTGGRR